MGMWAGTSVYFSLPNKVALSGEATDDLVVECTIDSDTSSIEMIELPLGAIQDVKLEVA